MLEIVPIVEEKISADTRKSGRGATLHDGWSKHGTQHVCLFASHIRKIKTIVEGKVEHEEKTS